MRDMFDTVAGWLAGHRSLAPAVGPTAPGATRRRLHDEVVGW
ncbi:MAG: hypothetical protein JWM47_611 [Acidimicrobiales bacterium]|nr:hypothetical protein [Acidimicrobiales bacterium]